MTLKAKRNPPKVTKIGARLLTKKAWSKADIKTREIEVLQYPLPDVYEELNNLDDRGNLSRSMLYSKLSRCTPYLLKRLLYESQSSSNPPAVRVQAAKVLLDKVMPNLEATNMSINSEDIQSLVIVKTNKKREEEPKT